MSSDRFKELKEVDEESKSELEESESEPESEEGDGTTGSTEASGSTGTTDDTGTTSTDSSTKTTESTETTGRTDTNSTDSSTGSTVGDSTTGSTTSTDTNGDTGSNGTTSGSVKDRNPRMAMFPPETHKNGYDDALRKIKALCSLSEEEEPNKLSEFSGAVLKHGYQDLEGLCEELGLEDAYEEYGDVVEE